MDPLSVFLLGSFEIKVDRESVTAHATSKGQALLAYLAVEAERPHRRETLAGLLWPEWPERSARTNLRNTLSSLRAAIGDRDATPPYLLVTRETIQFNDQSDPSTGSGQACWVDVRAFNRLAKVGEVDETTGRQLEEAIALYRGPFLEGFSVGDSPAFEEWALVVRERLQRQVLEAFRRLSGYHEERGEYERACQLGWLWVELAQWQEQAHRALMRALALSGQRDAALAQYEACRRALAEELDVEPEEETQALYHSIREGTLGARAQEPSRPVSPEVEPRRQSNLLAPLTPFVGRKEYLAQIGDRLQDPACRLLSLLGPGGVGKTRLALEAARGQLGSFCHGVFFVSLAPLRSVEGVIPAVAQVLDFSFYEGVEPRRQLLDYLREKEMLLLLDNWEHLLPGLAAEQVPIVTEILETAPGVKILATSRTRLSVRGEHLFPISGLRHPDWETPEDALSYSAVQLFLQSARRARPGFEPEEGDVTYMSRTCRLVGGMPLGILLAAAWVEMLTPAEIAAEVEQSIDFLATDLHDVPERQRSMRAVFDHSWRLLSDQERAAMQALSVFRGGFVREAAQEVTGVSLRGLLALVNKSLLHRQSTGRYDMHELLRQYTAEKLVQSADGGVKARDRHGAYYARALEEWREDLKGPQQRPALAEMEVEIDNARAAWRWAAGRGHVAELDRGMEGLGLFFERCVRYREGEAVFEEAARALAALLPAAADARGSSVAERDYPHPVEGGCPEVGEGLRVLSRILAWQTASSLKLGRAELAERLLGQNLALLDRPELADCDTRLERAFILRMAGERARVFEFDYDKARQCCEQSLALYRALGDRWEIANALLALAEVGRRVSALDEAEQLAGESLAMRRALGDQRGVAHSLWQMARYVQLHGRFEEALRWAREAVAVYRAMGDREGVALGLCSMGHAFGALGQFAQARSLVGEGLEICTDLGERNYRLAVVRNLLGYPTIHLGMYVRAQELFRRSLASNRQLDRWLDCVNILGLGMVALAEGAHSEAKRLLLEVVALARETGIVRDEGHALGGLACVARREGDLPQAWRHLAESLRIAVRNPNPMSLWRALAAATLLLGDGDQVERSVEIYTLLSRHPHVAHSVWYQDVFGKQIAAAAEGLPPEVVVAARERGKQRDLWDTAEELLAELEGRMSAPNGFRPSP